MATIDVTCTFCGNTLKVDGTFLGSTRACPACGKPVVIADRAEQASPPPVPSHAPQAATSRNCPVCGAAAELSTLFCPQCGYDWRLMPFFGRGGTKSWLANPVVTVALLAVIAGLLVYIAAGKRQGAGPESRAESAAHKGRAAEAQGARVADYLLDHPTESADTPAGKQDETAAVVEALLADTGPSYTQEELAEMQDRFRRRLSEQLDKRYPKYARGEQVALRKTNGLVQRGEFLGVKKDLVVITSEGLSIEVALEDLDRTTRVRCDPRFRDNVIAARLRQNMRELRNL